MTAPDFNNEKRIRVVDHDEELAISPRTPAPFTQRTAPPAAPAKPAATWGNMPNKNQLAIITLSRIVDFFQQASLQTLMYHQLQSFNPELPESTISKQAGILQGSFTAAQILTSVLWGRIADSPSVGRKSVLLIGLLGTGISLIGLAFSSTFEQATMWRIIGGGINGTVGAARTMLAENVSKEWHSRAFLLLPLAFNIANIIGPTIGSALVDPVASFPGLLGAGSAFGGSTGVSWMQTYPYAVTTLLSAFLQFGEAVLVAFFLHETLKAIKAKGHRESLTDQLRLVGNRFLRRGSTEKRADYGQHEGLLSDSDHEPRTTMEKTKPKARVLPFRRIFTSNLMLTLLSTAIFDFHMGAFNSLWLLFLSAARGDVAVSETSTTNGAPRVTPLVTARDILFARMSGGLSFTPRTVGLAMAFIGVIGVLLQFLLYPRCNARLGLMRCFRYSLFLFPIAYFLAPFVASLPSSTIAPLPATGVFIWLGIALIVFLQVTARTFALPASIMLVNNATPHPSVLGTIHGLGQATSATFRTLGPITAGGWFAHGLEQGNVAFAWWLVAAVSTTGCAVSYLVKNGNGHEIKLEGEDDEE